MQQKRKKEGRKEMFYLTTHSTHFIYGYMVSTVGYGCICNKKEKKKKKEKKIGYIYKINPHATPQCPVFTEAEALSAIPVLLILTFNCLWILVISQTKHVRKKRDQSSLAHDD